MDGFNKIIRKKDNYMKNLRNEFLKIYAKEILWINLKDPEEIKEYFCDFGVWTNYKKVNKGFLDFARGWIFAESKNDHPTAVCQTCLLEELNIVYKRISKRNKWD